VSRAGLCATQWAAVAALAVLVAGAAGCGSGWYERRARKAMEREDWAAAELAWRKALEQEPDDVEVLYGLGWTYHMAGQSPQARSSFEAAVKADAGSALGYKGLGSVSLAEGNVADARRWLEKALDRAPGDPAIENSLALAAMQANELDRALHLFSELYAAHPEIRQVDIGYAEALLRADRAGQAYDVVAPALEERGLAPRDEALLLQLRARIRVAMTSRRLDPDRCAQTAPAVLAWLDEAEADIERAKALDASIQELYAARRLVLHRKSLVAERCPASTAPEAAATPR
jgi:tetratricopeptide (TPR) repeat protein